MRLSCGPLLCFGEAGPRAAATPLSLQWAFFHALVQLDVPQLQQQATLLVHLSCLNLWRLLKMVKPL